jgi:hypothetical protein
VDPVRESYYSWNQYEEPWHTVLLLILYVMQLYIALLITMPSSFGNFSDVIVRRVNLVTGVPYMYSAKYLSGYLSCNFMHLYF